MSDELTAAGALYDKLSKGFWFYGRKRRKINHDTTKLQYALGLLLKEEDLVKGPKLISSVTPGMQKIKLEVGHAFF